jgi:hypothetical protein
VLHRDTAWPEFSGGWVSDYAELAVGDEPPGASPSDCRRWRARTSGNNMACRRAALVAVGGWF